MHAANAARGDDGLVGGRVCGLFRVRLAGGSPAFAARGKRAMNDAAERIRKKARESAATIGEFFDREAERIAECAVRMAERFDRGGRLVAMGNGGSACDAEHIVVEMVHPIVE